MSFREITENFLNSTTDNCAGGKKYFWDKAVEKGKEVME
jgi:hypothetical protein